jgi:site-specific DNA recombinase
LVGSPSIGTETLFRPSRPPLLLRGRYTIMAKDRYGCAVRRRRGTCDNGRTVDRQRIENRVLSGLKDKLLSPALVEDFFRAFAEEMAALRREAAGHRIQLEAELAEVRRRLQGIISAIEKGAYNATVQARLNELEARQAELVVQLDALETAAPVVQLHPNAAAIYRDKVADLESALNSEVDPIGWTGIGVT